MEKAHHINFKTIKITVMKTLKYLIPLMLLGVFTLTSCSKTETTTPQNGLSELEKTNLRLMREEEKLARDVYLYAHDLYGTQIFSNISNSEQIHMDKTRRFPIRSSANNQYMCICYDYNSKSILVKAIPTRKAEALV